MEIPQKTKKQKIIDIYLNYSNSLTTIDEFLKSMDIDVLKLNRIIDLGRKLHHYNWTNKHLTL